MKLLSAGFAILVIILIIKLLTLKRAIEKVGEEYGQTVSKESNILLNSSSSDKSIQRLVSALNREAILIRDEHLSLENRNTDLQQAITNVAHDLRTPLTAINGYSDLLLNEDLNENAKRYADIIKERTDNLNYLTEELFTFTLMSSGREEFEFEEVCINDELESTIAASYQMLHEGGITPDICIADKKIIRSLDKKALSRIFGNILSNAAKYSEGDLYICLNDEGQIIFVNSAPGLSEVETGKLFNRYYTVENAKGSTGLGLSIAKLLTDKMGGHIKAEYDNSKLIITITF